MKSLLVFLLIAVPASLWAQIAVSNAVVGSAGGFAESGEYRAFASVGQPSPPGAATNGQLRNISGFLAATIPGNPLVDVETVGDRNVPETFTLAQNFPNPFNPSTTIRYGLPTRSSVELKLYNTLSQCVRDLVLEEKEAGYHSVQVNAEGLASGVYFYRMVAGGFVFIKKCVLLR